MLALLPSIFSILSLNVSLLFFLFRFNSREISLANSVRIAFYAPHFLSCWPSIFVPVPSIALPALLMLARRSPWIAGGLLLLCRGISGTCSLLCLLFNIFFISIGYVCVVMIPPNLFFAWFFYLSFLNQNFSLPTN